MAQVQFSVYRYNPETRRPLRKLVFNVPTRRELSLGEKAISHGLAIASGVKASKDLGNMPPNIANPAYLASQARRLADDYETVKTKIIGEEEMAKAGKVWCSEHSHYRSAHLKLIEGCFSITPVYLFKTCLATLFFFLQYIYVQIYSHNI